MCFMILTTLAVNSITNVILACEAFFLSGLFYSRPKIKHSVAWYWQWSLLTLSASALLGGIDHGFFEIYGQTPLRKIIEHANWLLIGGLTLTVFLTSTRQFIRPGWHKYFYVAAGLQFALYAVVIICVDNFLVVILNYTPVMIWMLAGNLRGLKRGNGSKAMITGILLGFIASGIQASGIDVFSPVDRNSLYHFGMMAAVIFFYRGGLRLPGIITTDR